MTSSIKALAAVLAVVAGGTNARAGEAWQVDASAGVDYSSGAYGAPVDTEILMAPVALRAKRGPVRLTASIPWMRVDGPASVLSGGEGGPIIVDPGRGNQPSIREGWGDLNLGVAYSLPRAATGPLEIDLSGRVKLATASAEDGLSTGQTDYSVAVDMALPLRAWTPFVTLGYRMPGDTPDLVLENSVNAAAGFSYALGDRLVVLASYDYYQASTEALEDGQELFGALSGPITGRASWTLYGVVGLSEGSPDAEAGLMLTVPLS